MTTDTVLTRGERSFLAACHACQSAGVFPSNRNFIRVAKYTIPAGMKVKAMREQMVARGLLTITTQPLAGARTGRPMESGERAILESLALAEPRLDLDAIRDRFASQVERVPSRANLAAWVSRIRDANIADEAAIKARIHDETRAATVRNAERILGLERQRTELARIDTLSPRKACKVILRDWRRRFGARQQAADTRPTRFIQTAYNDNQVSRRMERYRGTTCRLRHSPYGMEVGVG